MLACSLVLTLTLRANISLACRFNLAQRDELGSPQSSPKREIKAEGEPAGISFITRPNDPQSIPSLSKDIYALGSRPLDSNEVARLELLKKARSLVKSLETPRETMIKHLWAQVRAEFPPAVSQPRFARLHTECSYLMKVQC